ncbi:ATP synthase subunit O, mitochondrial-like [Mytilus galloprovincialis]|uniref:ATP synthase subunit O, mitochondrial-like n=1 Tax=Mytilus galloprovincialis TaxID=29158 RepID=UPI003F7B5795
MAASRFGTLVRQFSSSAVRNQLVTPPVQVFGIEGRYATALYSAATKQKQLDSVEGELNTLKKLIKTDKPFAEFLQNPTFSRTEKKDTLTNIAKKQKLSDLTSNLFGALAENGRLNKLSGVLDAFEKIMSAHKGEVQCVVTTAKAMSATNEKEIRTVLQSFLKPGEKLFLTLETDPKLIGGMVVYIGDKYVDMSMASKINTYTNLIKQAV